MKVKPKIIVILGPTATGKSALTVSVAKAINGEVISSDSRQVYKGLDLGSGKITVKEMLGVPHHLLDVENPKKIFTVEDFKNLGENAVEKILRKDKIPIICGGTGFYIDALINAVTFPHVFPNPILRKKLQNFDALKLYKILKKLDQNRAKSIDPKNKVRLIRAIEIAKKLGNVPKLTQTKRFDTLKIGLDLPNSILKDKILFRLTDRINKGMVNEVRQLHKKGLSWKRLESFGLEYRFIAMYLEKKISSDEMLTTIQKETLRYAKRQRTWFKRDKEIIWFTKTTPSEIRKIKIKVNRFLLRKNTK